MHYTCVLRDGQTIVRPYHVDSQDDKNAKIAAQKTYTRLQKLENLSHTLTLEVIGEKNGVRQTHIKEFGVRDWISNYEPCDA
jgi:hypothetical protein